VQNNKGGRLAAGQYYAALKQNSPPVKGWIRAIREALGMSGTQLANRLKVSQPRIPRLEQDELSGVVSLKTMRQAAEAPQQLAARR
jgi:predicted DNA-binding mobile mystery protein A